MKNLTKKIKNFITIRCINKDTFDYVDIQIPINFSCSGSWVYFLKIARYYAGWSDFTGWGEGDVENLSTDFHYYALLNEEGKYGTLFVPSFPNGFLLDIDLKTNQPTNESLEKAGITKGEFFRNINVKRLK